MKLMKDFLHEVKDNISKTITIGKVKNIWTKYKNQHVGSYTILCVSIFE